ncbi:MAG: isoleucine--tRNA ligase, partial [Candidatus Nanoarchaeia archaeon]
YVLKDCYRRFLRMAGFNVFDQPGFDTHGLPIENKVEKKLGIQNKKEIVSKIGVENFVKECENFVQEKIPPMISDFKNLGVWMDWKKPYITCLNSYIEGAWWAIAQAWKNNLLYNSLKVNFWCPHCSTALAKHELEYKQTTDNAIFVKFKVKNKDNEYLLVWTTTPWTIPFNLAVMANPNLYYVRAKFNNEIWILAEDLAEHVSKILDKSFIILERIPGKKLEGLEYTHPLEKEIDFSKFASEWLHKVILSEEYVSANEGTGLVHCAPGCGPEDFEVGQKYKLYPFNELDEQGIFSEKTNIFVGLKAREDDNHFIKALEEKGALAYITKYAHEYPYCGRCHSAVVFRVTPQWFISTSKLKEKMLANSNAAKWTPDWAKTWFNSWLENIQDWNISRQRFWGIPIPIWVCKQCSNIVVIGSIKELRERKVKVPKDLHKPWIDKVYLKCEKCKGAMERVPDVCDVWLDSGAAPWASTGDQSFIADFILEGKDQIRGWFYLLMALSTAARNKTPYKAVYMHGMINDAQGRKMSKSLGNVILPSEVTENYGIDAFRFYTIGGAEPGLDLNYNFADVKTKAANLQVFWNIHLYLQDLLTQSEIEPKELINIDIKNLNLKKEDQYMLSRLNSTILRVTELFKAHKLNEVPWQIENLFLELSRWYIKAIRERSTDLAAIYMINKVLFECLKLFAPIAPFITEAIYQNLRKITKFKEDSVHLLEWPKYDEKLIDTKLEAEFALLKDVLSNILALREKIARNLRWPIKKIIVLTENEEFISAIKTHEDLLKRLANVLTIEVGHNLSGLTHNVKADFSKIGPKFGKKSAEIVAALARIAPEAIVSSLRKNGKFVLQINGEKVELNHDDLLIEEILPVNLEGGLFGSYSLYVDKEETAEMLASGFLREFTRAIQSLRKKAGLKKSDKISLYVFANSKAKTSIDEKVNDLCTKVGAEKLEFTSEKIVAQLKWQDKLEIKGYKVIFGF